MSSCWPRNISPAPKSATSATAAAPADLQAGADVAPAAMDHNRSGHGLERGHAQRVREGAHLGLVSSAAGAALEMGGDHRALELRQLSVQTDGDLPTNPFTDERPNRSHVHSDEPERPELAVTWPR